MVSSPRPSLSKLIVKDLVVRSRLHGENRQNLHIQQVEKEYYTIKGITPFEAALASFLGEHLRWQFLIDL